MLFIIYLFIYLYDFVLVQDGLEDYEVAYGVKTCVHSIFTYNTWRDRCLPAPAHDALIHEVRVNPPPQCTTMCTHPGADTPGHRRHRRHAQLWEECHRRIKRTLRADSDLFAQMERELGPLTEVKGARRCLLRSTRAANAMYHTVAAAMCDSHAKSIAFSPAQLKAAQQI
jgi:hypothetical protein